MRQKIDKLFTFAFVIVLLLVAFTAGSSISKSTTPNIQPKSNISSASTVSIPNLDKLVKSADGSIVDINTQLQYQQAAAAGTGMIISKKGLVVTNNHVIDGATTITVKVGGVGETYAAKIVADDPTLDIALLQIKATHLFHPIKFSNSSQAKVGEKVVAIGNALDIPGKPKVTTGKISSLSQSLVATTEQTGSSENLYNMFKSTATVEPGNSGGPLLNTQGSVISMNTAAKIENPDQPSQPSFSIPANRIKSTIHLIEEHSSKSALLYGSPAFLGVDVATIDQATLYFARFGEDYAPAATSGVAILNVISDTPAAASGLVAGDIITEVNNTPVISPANLSRYLAKIKPGTSVTVSFSNASETSNIVNIKTTSGPAT